MPRPPDYDKEDWSIFLNFLQQNEKSYNENENKQKCRIFCSISFVQTALSQPSQPLCTCDALIDPTSPTVTVTASEGVYIRSQACTSSTILGSLTLGKQFNSTSDCLGECVDDVDTWLVVTNPDGFIWSGTTDYPGQLICPVSMKF